MTTKYSNLMPFLDNVIYIIYEDNKDFNINEINKQAKSHPEEEIYVEIPNTKGITSSMLKKLENNVNIRIAGAYDLERMTLQKNKMFRNKNGKKRALEYYFTSVIYTKEEAIIILEEIEKIESHMIKYWSDIQKLVYLYATLKRKITYDPKFEDRTDDEVRSLRGLISKETVCAGYSLILKELLDRQDIKCMWVGGNNEKGHGHAWNVVEIEGKLYPIDITYENKKFRDGIQESYSFLGQNVEKFNKGHQPDIKDPNNGYQDKLSEFDTELIKYISSTVILEEEYEKISFRCERKNKEQFLLVQIDTRKANNETYYIYYYDKIINGKAANNPLILASKETISHYVDNENFNKENILSGNDITEILFSEENINDTLNRRSLYVGEFENFKMVKGYANKLRKKEKDLKLFRFSPRVYPKEDGTVLVVEQISKGPIILGNTQAYKFNIYDIVYNEENKPILRRRTIYSDTNIIYSNKDEIQNKLLSEENISNAIKNNCGYVGYINNSNEVAFNNQLLRYFDKTINYMIRDFEEDNKHIR